jgi:transposase-like protein
MPQDGARKNRRHTPEQLIRKLAEGNKVLNQGQTVEEVARHLEIAEATWHRWRNQLGRCRDSASTFIHSMGSTACSCP